MTNEIGTARIDEVLNLNPEVLRVIAVEKTTPLARAYTKMIIAFLMCTTAEEINAVAEYWGVGVMTLPDRRGRRLVFGFGEKHGK
jgi:hypothetical protein